MRARAYESVYGGIVFMTSFMRSASAKARVRTRTRVVHAVNPNPNALPLPGINARRQECGADYA